MRFCSLGAFRDFPAAREFPLLHCSIILNIGRRPPKVKGDFVQCTKSYNVLENII
jgi:hypothetical protein